MRPPRRVPWATKAELAELYDMIFAPGSSNTTRRAAISWMSIYISSPSCPAFLHLLHTLVGAMLLPYPPPSAQEASVTRMTYAMAIVRFVNGMVDPMQTGPYARPISHLAATLGLPPSLVALRHRATHEDLPPLTLLRHALEQATDYVQHHSFLPLLASSSAAAGAGWNNRARVEALVGRWKKIVKTRVRARDVTNESESGQALRRLKRDIEAENVEDLVEAVVRVGLVPVSHKKRPNKRATEPTKELLQIWTPLLSHIAATHPAAGGALAECLTSVLLDTAPRFNEPAPDAANADEMRRELLSYRWALGTWLIWLWENDDPAMAVSEDERLGVLRRFARELVHDDIILRRIYGMISDGKGLSAEDLDKLLVTEKSKKKDEDELVGFEVDEAPQEQVDVEAVLGTMEANLRSLEQKLASHTADVVMEEDGERVEGWHKAEAWVPCPIGVWA